ncbi:MAG: tRNA lysidine(34) synthetase TilS [Alphaproteobacteria bacterium]|nr:tRNA lysidine(34) synthetase TilS [Alphaproteobacteria bacterium]
MTDKKTHSKKIRILSEGLNHQCAFMDRFCVTMEGCFGEAEKGAFPEKIAVGVSGGADSMALCHALADYVQAYAPYAHIYVVSIDHRLRPEAAGELRFVEKEVSSLSNISHHILVWEQGDQQDTRIEEEARNARYDLLGAFVAEHEIGHLFIAHHQNDQAETFLFRLAKGSGVDGLACMSMISSRCYDGHDFTLCRPFLGEEKSEILTYMQENSFSYIEDPSNQNRSYARIRLRQSMDVLADEGLSPKRLYTTSKRMNRAKEALTYLSDCAYKNALISMDTSKIVLEYGSLASQPLEIVIRVVLLAMEKLNGKEGAYGPRLERVEHLCEDLIQPNNFRKRTLGGIIFEHKTKSGEIVLSLEKQSL